MPSRRSPTPSASSRRRRRDRGVTMTWGAWALVGLVLLVGAVALFGLEPEPPCGEEQTCVTVDELAAGYGLEESYHIYDRSGQVMADVGGTNRRFVPLEDIPPRVRDAWIAVEDRRFRDHGGIDLKSVGRAMWANVTNGSIAEGASTIPMQLVRVLWPETVRSMSPWRRKLLEARLAPRLVDELGKDRVLELYLNGIYLGQGVYGVGLASEHYFGVPPDSLSLSQLATLVGMTKTPERLDPRENPERSRARRDVVLDLLTEAGVVSAAEAREAASEAIQVTEKAPTRRSRSYVTAAVRRELEQVAPELVGRQGLRIYTTVDPRAQESARRRLRAHLSAVERGAMGRYLGGSAPLQGGLVAMESGSGAILALVGGRDFSSTQLNRPLQSRRPVGSLAKPILLAAALEHGISSTRAISTSEISMEGAGGKTWSPADHVSDDWLLPRDMVVRSSNRAAVHLGQEVGVERFATQVRSMGVDEDVPSYPSSFLGAFEASLAEMTAAYAALENGGHRVEPFLIRSVEDSDGRLLWDRGTVGTGARVVSDATAHLVLDAMRDVVNRGTAWRVRRYLDGPAGGKTGTTDEGRDAWFVGVRPGLAAGVWIGLDRPGTISEGASGGRLAAPLWGQWMSDLAQAGYGQGGWTPPPRVTSVRLLERRRGDRAYFCVGDEGEGTSLLIRSSDLSQTPRCRIESPWPFMGSDDRSDTSRFRRPESIRFRSGADSASERLRDELDRARERRARWLEERERALRGGDRPDSASAPEDTVRVPAGRPGDPADTVPAHPGTDVRPDTVAPSPRPRPDTVPEPDTVVVPDTTVRPDTAAARPDTTGAGSAS